MPGRQLQVGDAPDPFVAPPVTLTDIVRYQGASGDFNPLHHDPEAARRAGYPGPFSVGMLQAGRLATLVTDWLGPRNIRRFKVRFLEQVWPGDVLTYRAQVVSVEQTERGQRVELELSATLERGPLHASGSATFELQGS